MDTNDRGIAAAYNRIAAWFDSSRNRALIERPWLEYLAQSLKPGASILDLGCGTGEPILRFFVGRRFAVTGVDASTAMIAIAARRFPGTRFLAGDMRALDLRERFDALIAWHSLFHLPPEDQRAMFGRFAQLLNPGGLLMFTSGSERGEVWSENGGEALYHASLNLAEYRSLLETHGFRIEKHVLDDAGCGGATVWVARYFPG
jgi:ubiquinone/menaquinone biosynthesis C-methylase UbiE